MPALALILLVVSFLAAKTVPGARAWGGIVFGLIDPAGGAGDLRVRDVPVIGALHGLNALLLFAAAVRAAMLTRTGGGAGTVSGRRARQSAGRRPSGSSLPV